MTKHRPAKTLFALAILAAGSLLRGKAAAEDRPVRVYPPRIDLSGSRDNQTIVVQQWIDEGHSQDVTAEAALRVADERIAKVDGTRVIPLADGETELVVVFGGQAIRLPLMVRDAASDPPLSFRREVMPILTKAGCNAGRCHGAARGKDGFHLSLFGYDPEGDHGRLLTEMPGRRLNLSLPEASLLLTKATGLAPHSGGRRFDVGSEHHAALLRWVSEGASAPGEEDENVRAERIVISPPESVLVDPAAEQRLVVLAHYSDGSDRDVTHLCAFISNNENTARVDDAGVVRAGARGEALVMARFATFTEGVRVIVHDGPATTPHEPTPAPCEIDRLVNAKLRRLRIKPSGIAGDERFLRRVCLDLTGLLPTPELRERFLSDTRPDKRARLIDELIATEAFVDVWTMRLGELLRIRSDNQVSYKALLGFHDWVHQRIADDQPLDKLFAEVLSATGGTFDTPATNYFQIEANHLKLAENVAQTFMGMRVQCAQCHNHPFDRWTMDDYYGFAAFFSQVGFKQSHDPREFIVYNRGAGEVKHFVGQRPVEPVYLGGGPAQIEGRDRRRVLAEWIVSEENPPFARNLANIVWAHHFGRGIVEPVDDVRISNPPSNPELLQHLTDQLVESGYRLRPLVREVCNSQTYQRSTEPTPSNVDDVANFSRAPVRRLRAEALLDSISQVTETSDRFPRLPVGARAAEIADGAVSNYFLTTFGRAPRETVCACEVDVTPDLSQAFHLLNGDATNDKVREGRVVEQMLAEGAPPEEVIERLFIRCLSRRPTPTEVAELRGRLDPNAPREGLEDVFWALLNSKEFLFNH